MKLGYPMVANILKIYLWILGLLLLGILALFTFFELDQVASGSGTVRTKEWVEVKPEVSGIINSMFVQEGEKVQKGKILFTIENKDRQVELKQAEVKIFELSTNISKLERQIVSKEDEILRTIEEAKAQLQVAEEQYQQIERGPKTEELQLAQDKITQAHIQWEEAVQTYQRTQKTYQLEPGLKKIEAHRRVETLQHQIALREDEVERGIEEARALFQAAKARYQLLQQGPRSEEIRVSQDQVARAKVEKDKLADDYQQLQAFYAQHPELKEVGERLKPSHSSQGRVVKARFQKTASQTTSELPSVAQQRILKAQHVLENAQKRYEQNQKLAALDMASEFELNNAFSAFKQAEADFELIKGQTYQEFKDTFFQKEASEKTYQLAQNELKLLLNKYSPPEVQAALAERQRSEASLKKAVARKREVDLLKVELSAVQKSQSQELELSQASAEKRLQDSLHAMKQAEIYLQLMKGELALLQNKFDPNQVRIALAEVERAKAILKKAESRKIEPGLLKNDLATLNETLAKEEKYYQVVQEKLNLTEIKATIDGFILTHETESLLGKAFNAGETVLRLGDSSQYIITATIPENDFPLIKVGQAARIQVAPFPKGEYQLFQAKVLTVGADSQKDSRPSDLSSLGSLSSLIKGSGPLSARTFPVTLELKKPYSIEVFDQIYEIKPGFSVDVEIITQRERILTLLFRRVLRVQGSFNTDRLHLSQEVNPL